MHGLERQSYRRRILGAERGVHFGPSLTPLVDVAATGADIREHNVECWLTYPARRLGKGRGAVSGTPGQGPIGRVAGLGAHLPQLEGKLLQRPALGSASAMTLYPSPQTSMGVYGLVVPPDPAASCRNWASVPEKRLWSTSPVTPATRNELVCCQNV